VVCIRLPQRKHTILAVGTVTHTFTVKTWVSHGLKVVPLLPKLRKEPHPETAPGVHPSATHNFARIGLRELEPTHKFVRIASPQDMTIQHHRRESFIPSL
jgi:hypothetical protein